MYASLCTQARVRYHRCFFLIFVLWGWLLRTLYTQKGVLDTLFNKRGKK